MSQVEKGEFERERGSKGERERERRNIHLMDLSWVDRPGRILNKGFG